MSCDIPAVHSLISLFSFLVFRSKGNQSHGRRYIFIAEPFTEVVFFSLKICFLVASDLRVFCSNLAQSIYDDDDDLCLKLSHDDLLCLLSVMEMLYENVNLLFYFI